MRVELDPSILKDTSCFKYVDQIVRLFEDGRHEWMHGDQKDTILNSDWFRQLGRSQQNTLRDLLDVPESSRKGAFPSIYVTHRAAHAKTYQMKPREAAQWLAQPLHLLVEDPKGGGRLLEYVLLHLNRTRVEGRLGRHSHAEFLKSWSSSENGPLGDRRFVQVLNGGGSATANELERYISTGDSNQPAPLLLIIVDSDKRYPTHEVRADSTSGKVRTVLARLNGIRKTDSLFGDWGQHLRILKKSEVENYLPEEGLREGNAEPTYLNAWKQLPPEHQDFIDLKSGLKNSLKNADKHAETQAKQQDLSTWEWRLPEEKSFWHRVVPPDGSQSILSPLFQGQGTKLCQGFTKKLPPSALRKRDGNGELDEMLNWILSAL